MIVEYAGVVAAMSILVSTITGTFGQKLAALPTSQGTALTAVSAGARAQKVGVPEARTVYKQAPYSKPVLKYLYTVGWIGGKKSVVSCLFARTSRDDTEREALTEIRKNAKLVRQLRRVHVPLKIAASTLVRGIASACS